MYLLLGTLARLPTHIPIPLVSRTRPRFFQHKRAGIHSLNPCCYLISYHLPVEGPKPHTRRYPNPIACLEGPKPQSSNPPFACQGAEALCPLSPIAEPVAVAVAAMNNEDYEIQKILMPPGRPMLWIDTGTGRTNQTPIPAPPRRPAVPRRCKQRSPCSRRHGIWGCTRRTALRSWGCVEIELARAAHPSLA